MVLVQVETEQLHQFLAPTLHQHSQNLPELRRALYKYLRNVLSYSKDLTVDASLKTNRHLFSLNPPSILELQR